MSIENLSFDPLFWEFKSCIDGIDYWITFCWYLEQRFYNLLAYKSWELHYYCRLSVKIRLCNKWGIQILGKFCQINIYRYSFKFNFYTHW